LEWDSGFAAEFAVARDLIVQGADFRDILRAVYERAFGVRILVANGASAVVGFEEQLEARLAQFGRLFSFEYVARSGELIQVHEYPTPAGGVFRAAKGITARERPSYAVVPRECDQWVAAREVPFWFRRDANGHFAFAPASAELCRFYDVPLDFGAGDPLAFYSLVEETPDERARTAAAVLESAETLGPFSVNVRTRGPGGRLKFVRATFAPSRENDGSIIWKGLLRDITKERQAEDELELLRSAVVHSGDGIMIFETVPPKSEGEQPKAFILYINRAFEELCGYKDDEIVGKTCDDFSFLYEESDLGERVAALLAAGDSRSFEFEMYGAAGRSFWVEGRVVILQRDPDETFRWALVVRDIAERRRVHAELVKAKDRAEAANLAKSQFLANMSHELRTPLNAIIGFSEVIKDELIGPSGNARYREYANDIHHSGRHLLAIIEDVLEMSKIEADRLELRESDVDFTAVVEAALKLVRQQAMEFGVKLASELPSGLPLIRADTLRLKQILLNLLSNAIKFCKAGARVGVGAEVLADGSFCAWVQDTGIGMTAQELAIALEPFRQVANELTRNHGGTGLGLPLANRLIALHGGRLELESEPRVGTIARIVLPPNRVLPAASAGDAAVDEQSPTRRISLG